MASDIVDAEVSVVCRCWTCDTTFDAKPSTVTVELGDVDYGADAGWVWEHTYRTSCPACEKQGRMVEILDYNGLSCCLD